MESHGKLHLLVGPNLVALEGYHCDKYLKLVDPIHIPRDHHI